MTSEKRAELEARLASYKEALSAAVEQQLQIITRGVRSYKLDTGEGNQSTVKMTAEDIAETIRFLESRIENLEQKLSGGGVTYISLDR